MRKFIKTLVLLIGIILTGCIGNKNEIPKQYLGKYKLLYPGSKISEEGKIIEKYSESEKITKGYATLSKKGSRYTLYIKRDPSENYLAKENRAVFLDMERDNLEMNAQLRKVEGEKGEYKEYYTVYFKDEKIIGDENKSPASIWYAIQGKKNINLEKVNGKYILSIYGHQFIKE
ncbi:hypothetical protein [Cetobacterium sp.]|uniref:hypothetical protein n=1 Tax=Cetobacterium sp. TaxID=2071632 RepID=UPI0025BBC71C|nr:hypothetical protein [Cetobacterium sp.]